MDDNLYHADNPRRPVDWRWERAKIALQKGISRKRDDPWICKAARFKRDHDNCREDTDWYTLIDKYPDLIWAHDIAKNTGLDGSPLKSALEARMLAGDDWDRIARIARTKPAVLEAYESVFYNIEEDRQNEDYVLHQVMGPALYLGFQEQEYDLIWKLFGYKGGPSVLDVMIGVIGETSKPTTRDGVSAWMVDVTRDGLRKKAMMAVHVLRLNNFNAIEVIDKLLKLIEIEKLAKGGGGGATEGMLENVKVMMTTLGSAFTVGKRPGHEPTPQTPFDRRAAELRGDELIALGAGQVLPHGHELVSLAFPEPMRRDEGFPGGEAGG